MSHERQYQHLDDFFQSETSIILLFGTIENMASYFKHDVGYTYIDVGWQTYLNNFVDMGSVGFGSRLQC